MSVEMVPAIGFVALLATVAGWAFQLYLGARESTPAQGESRLTAAEAFAAR